MKLVDMNDGRAYSTADLKRDWTTFRKEEPENHAADFRTEFLEIIMATINGRNDLEIVGPTPRELSAVVDRLRASLPPC